ncbi:transcription factor [Ganoderma sinense ZZ0214-1]|uniref:Transcription factor n=1 Tax=Ganoderma sinense ZZ0214-1 TaxID=1077348 RepID=A0A2G8SS75_9APHY|nr:transcription factor [Ganoderma sinense ZZ0214-1]
MTPENAAQFEYHKMQLIGSLQTLANNMKECAAVAEQYAHIISGVPYMGNPNVFPPLANGQYPMPIMAPMAQDEQGKKRKARGDDGEGKRRVKKPKDPNAPKRPASSYLLFQNDIRSELKQKNPGMRNADLLNAISKLWSEMPQSQKDAYENRNKELKDQWRADKAVYESGKAGASGLPVAASTPAAPVAAAPVVTKAVPAPAVVATVEEESSDEETPAEEDENSSSDSSSDEDEAAPPPKKSKKETSAAAAKGEATETKKEKKHKKTKA